MKPVRLTFKIDGSALVPLANRAKPPPRIASEIDRKIRVLRIEAHSPEMLEELIAQGARQLTTAPWAVGDQLKDRPIVQHKAVLAIFRQVRDGQAWVVQSLHHAAARMRKRGARVARPRRRLPTRGAVAVFAQAQGGERTRTKTRAGKRTVDVGPTALKLLREQQLVRAPNADGLLFPTRLGNPFDGNNFMHRVFKPAARAAGIPELTFHDLRHTGASLMIAAGCHVKVIADQMGHADGGALVLSRYGHLYKGARHEAAIALESHLFGRAADSDVGSVWDGDQQAWDLR